MGKYMSRTRAAFAKDANGYIHPVRLTLQPLPALQPQLRQVLARFSATRHLQLGGAIVGSSPQASATPAGGSVATRSPLLATQCVVGALQPIPPDAVTEEFVLVRE